MRTTRQGRNSQGGYALLAILVAAVVVSIMLARSLPREAMRAQRLREERLIMRGEQYKRAVELYFREHKKYPEELDDLEDTNGVRYLRRRYQDPITGEDEWRLIHMGADGKFKDSLIYDTEEEGEEGSGSGFRGRQGPSLAEARRRAQITQSNSAYGGLNQFDGADRALQTRQSAAPDSFGNNGPAVIGPNVGTLSDPADDAVAQTSGQLGPDGQPLPNAGQPDYTQLPPGQVPANAGQRPQQQQVPGTPENRTGFRGRTGGVFGGGAAPTAPAGTPAGFGSQGIAPDAANVIQRLLTTPRPGGLAGLRGGQNVAGQLGQAAGGLPQFQEGVAGVASKSDKSGVKIYQGRETYNEWEFVFDYRESGDIAGQTGVAGTGSTLQQGQPGLTPGGFMTAPQNPIQPGPVQPQAPQTGNQPARRRGRRDVNPAGFPGMPTAPPPTAPAPPTQAPEPVIETPQPPPTTDNPFRLRNRRTPQGN